MRLGTHIYSLFLALFFAQLLDIDAQIEKYQSPVEQTSNGIGVTQTDADDNETLAYSIPKVSGTSPLAVCDFAHFELNLLPFIPSETRQLRSRSPPAPSL